MVEGESGIKIIFFTGPGRTETIHVLDSRTGSLVDPVGIGFHGLLKCGFAGFGRIGSEASSGKPHISCTSVIFPGFLPNGQVLFRVEHIGQ